jgi:hypothetical protein
MDKLGLEAALQAGADRDSVRRVDGVFLSFVVEDLDRVWIGP